MKKAIYLRLIALTVAAVFICSFVSAVIYAFTTQSLIKEWLTKLTYSAAENYRHNTDVYDLSRFSGGNRITVIAPDGKVIADSEANAAEMENHLNRDEVKYAKSTGVTIAVRKSSTLGENFMYASIIADDGNILRLAYSYSGILHNLAVEVPAMLAAIVIAVIMSLILAARFTKTVTNPLEKMIDALAAHDYEELGTHKSPYYEIDKMMQTLQDMLQRINDSGIRLQSEREKTEYIMSSMAEGFVLLDEKNNILLCNSSARLFFGYTGSGDPTNIYYLTRSQAVINALNTATANEQATVFDLELPGGIVASVYVSPSKTNEQEPGATMLIVDMTAERALEKQKRDFFSNASHELKTPITSIVGFSEMLSNGMVKTEQDKAEVIGRIETEAKRMSQMIGDILSISKLESGIENKEYPEINITEIVRDAVKAVLPVKDSTEIGIELSLDEVSYPADKQHIHEICVNLIENAVKYNKPEGKVFVSLKKETSGVILTVKDTGIGIAPEYQTRVFERFFRVDSGRDKKIGGTGLGLSIVKHIVSLYGGQISLISKKDCGTEISVTLPG